MRKLLFAAAAGATVLGGAMVAQTAQAQRYDGYYERVTPGYHYDTYGRRYFEDRYGRHYVDEAAPRYDYDDSDDLAVGGVLLGSVLGHVPYDRYGPDPNGMIARDGHRIKCKLSDTWDYRVDRYVTRRVCD